MYCVSSTNSYKLEFFVAELCLSCFVGLLGTPAFAILFSQSSSICLKGDLWSELASICRLFHLHRKKTPLWECNQHKDQRDLSVCIPHVSQHQPVCMLCLGSLWTGCEVGLDRIRNENSGDHHKEHKQQIWNIPGVKGQAVTAVDSFNCV